MPMRARKAVKLPEKLVQVGGTAPPAKACWGTPGKLGGRVTSHLTEPIGSQVLRAAMPRDAVHRLNVGRGGPAQRWHALKI